MKVAIVHHWYITKGGGERVAEVLAGMFPQADLFTLVMDEKRQPAWFAGRKVKSSFLQHIPGATRYHRHFLPLYPLAVEQLDLTAYDLVISSDSGPVKGVIIGPGATHVCYCHSPMRYLWDGYHSYLESMPAIARLPFILSAHYVRNWEALAAQRVTHFVANSNYVAGRIKKYYGRESTVIYPPVDTGLGSIGKANGDYYLAAGRMVPYKKTDILIRACNRLNRRLMITGTGPELKRLRSIAGPTIEFLGELATGQFWEKYAGCRALLFGADEDFGMVPLEAQACGRPVIAYGKGGSLETVRGLSSAQLTSVNGKCKATGVFFYEQTEEALSQAILSFEAAESSFSSQVIREHALQFDTSMFIQRMGNFLRDVVGLSGGATLC